MRSRSRQAKRKLKLWSARDFAALDGRLIEAKVEKKIIAELTAHVGGAPTVPQRIMIQRIARSLMMTGIIERRCIENADLGDLQARQLIALNNSIRLALHAIGIERNAPALPTPVEYLNARRLSVA